MTTDEKQQAMVDDAVAMLIEQGRPCAARLCATPLVVAFSDWVAAERQRQTSPTEVMGAFGKVVSGLISSLVEAGAKEGHKQAAAADYMDWLKDIVLANHLEGDASDE